MGEESGNSHAEGLREGSRGAGGPLRSDGGTLGVVDEHGAVGGPLRADGGVRANGVRGRLPIGVQTFREVRESGDYYVDKTGYAGRMINEGEVLFFVSASSFR